MSILNMTILAVTIGNTYDAKPLLGYRGMMQQVGYKRHTLVLYNSCPRAQVFFCFFFVIFYAQHTGEQ